MNASEEQGTATRQAPVFYGFSIEMFEALVAEYNKQSDTKFPDYRYVKSDRFEQWGFGCKEMKKAGATKDAEDAGGDDNTVKGFRGVSTQRVRARLTRNESANCEHVVCVRVDVNKWQLITQLVDAGDEEDGKKQVGQPASRLM